MAKEYIEKDQMHDILAGQFCACSDEVEETINAIWAEVRALPAANVRENVTGEWIEKWSGNGWNEWVDCTCSVCGMEFERFEIKANFCPTCGADMRPEPPKEET